MTIIYTDGAASGNPGPGGWGVFIIQGKKTQKLWGREAMTTNNKMELRAAIEGLKYFKFRRGIILRTDSKYVLKGIEEWMDGWKSRDWKTSGGKPVKNKGLWQELDYWNNFHNVTWEWVKGHSGDYGNDTADRLATF